MSDLFWLTDVQMARLEPLFPKSHGRPHKTLYNRWKRWSDSGVFARMMAGLAAKHGEERTVMIDATYGQLWMGGFGNTAIAACTD